MALEKLGEKDRWDAKRVEGEVVECEGDVNSEARNRPNKAEVSAAHSIRASYGWKWEERKDRKAAIWCRDTGWRRGRDNLPPCVLRIPLSK